MKSLQHEIAAGPVRRRSGQGAYTCRISLDAAIGSHIRLTTDTPFQHHVTVPVHDALKVGTVAGILSDVAAHLKISRDDLMKKLFG